MVAQNAIPNLNIGLQVHYRLIRIGAVPHCGIDVMLPTPRFKCLDVLRAPEGQISRRWKPVCIAPNGRKAVVGLIHKVTEVAGPTAVIVAKEEQSAIILQKEPARKMNSGYSP